MDLLRQLQNYTLLRLSGMYRPVVWISYSIGSMAHSILYRGIW